MSRCEKSYTSATTRFDINPSSITNDIRLLEARLGEEIAKKGLSDLLAWLSPSNPLALPPVRGRFQMLTSSIESEHFCKGTVLCEGDTPINCLFDLPCSNTYFEVMPNGRLKRFRRSPKGMLTGTLFIAEPLLDTPFPLKVTESLKSQALGFIEAADCFYRSPHYQRAIELNQSIQTVTQPVSAAV